MWVAGRLEFSHPIDVGAAIERRSTITSVTGKNGRSGPLVFVCVRHEIRLKDKTALTEDQHLVFRRAAEAGGRVSSPPGRRPERIAEFTRSYVPDALQLFHFSALTYNAHRIHYDRDYAREVEGYPGLVVQGPLIATLLMDLCLRRCGESTVRSFEFRAERPLFDGAPIDLCYRAAGSGAELWALDASGTVAMSAAAEYTA